MLHSEDGVSAHTWGGEHWKFPTMTNAGDPQAQFTSITNEKAQHFQSLEPRNDFILSRRSYCMEGDNDGRRFGVFLNLPRPRRQIPQQAQLFLCSIAVI
jgi:hypothetical protein